MAANPRTLLDLRSVIVAVVVLLVGGALGFAVGYRYEQHNDAVAESSTAAKATTPPPVDDGEAKQNAAKVNTVLIQCLAKQGVIYPADATDLSKPPEGVSADKHKAALDTCGRELLGGQ